jgi:hypothetical protein
VQGEEALLRQAVLSNGVGRDLPDDRFDALQLGLLERRGEALALERVELGVVQDAVLVGVA